ncbi:MAG: winged helix-turn-helix domain-containing protein [Geobacteraceae bacterium]|nr:winged helix-turn-helix domain-containing protein [Geobacteraceae bacterium]
MGVSLASEHLSRRSQLRPHSLLLEFLMRNPNKTLTRATIADNVWAKNELCRFTNIVDVYINYLRKKIDHDRNGKLIHTVRRAGYIMKEV